MPTGSDGLEKAVAGRSAGRRHQALHLSQFGLVQALLVQHLAEQAGVSGVILDQEKNF
jgi:hypothetical protein